MLGFAKRPGSYWMRPGLRLEPQDAEKNRIMAQPGDRVVETVPPGCEATPSIARRCYNCILIANIYHYLLDWGGVAIDSQ